MEMSVVGLLDVWHVHRPIVFLLFLLGTWLPCTRREGQEILAIHQITIGQAT